MSIMTQRVQLLTVELDQVLEWPKGSVPNCIQYLLIDLQLNKSAERQWSTSGCLCPLFCVTSVMHRQQ